MARMWRNKMFAGFRWESLDESLGNLGINGRARNRVAECGLSRWGLRDVVVVSCDSGDEHSGVIKPREFLYWLRTYWLLKSVCSVQLVY